MRKFTNPNVKRENNKIIRNLIVALIILIGSFGFKYWEQVTIKNVKSDVRDLNTLIESEGTNDSKKSYLNITQVPYQFAVRDDITDSYYIVTDGKYLYIAYMTEADFNKLNNEDIKNNPIKIEGITKVTSEEIKKLAVDVYNESFENQITMADFDNYFGSIYLDMTVNEEDVASFQFILFLIFFVTGIVCFIVSLVRLTKFNKIVKKLDAVKMEELDNEMNDKSSFYYDKLHLYLTKNYIINFNSSFKAIKYSDVLWMYPFEQRTNGFKTAKAIKILTNEGKTYTIATVDVFSKKKQEIYNEIWDTIASKNNRILLGYTKENIKAMKEKVKEIKNNK